MGVRVRAFVHDGCVLVGSACDFYRDARELCAVLYDSISSSSIYADECLVFGRRWRGLGLVECVDRYSWHGARAKRSVLIVDG